MSSTLGIIIGNRDFFPDHLITEARNEVLNIFKNKGLKPIILKDSDTKLGGVETFLEAQKCADLFKSHKDEIEGILVVLPNFGDEKGVADTIRLSGLDVPVLVQATPDDLDKMQPSNRRDAYCGKISVCNNLYQYSYLAEQYPNRVEWDMEKLLIVTIDIEVQCENGFPDPSKALEELLSITIKNHQTKEIVVWGIGDFKSNRS